MNFLFISHLDFANVSYSLSEALNRAGHHSRVITGQRQRFNLPYDIGAWEEGAREVYKEELKSADVLVFGSSYFDWRPFNLPIPKGIRKCLWHGGTNYRQNYQNFNELINPTFDIVYSHWDLLKLYDKMCLLNAPLDTSKFPMEPRKVPKKWVIGHAPSDPMNKGSAQFSQAMGMLKQNYDIDVRFFANLEHTTLMNNKRFFDIYFDQILNQPIPIKGRGVYGLALVESAACGSACLCSGGPSPIIPVKDAKDIYEHISKFIDGYYRYETVSKAMIDFVKWNHSYEACVDQFLAPMKEKGWLN